jgi:DNA-binding Lrp family transcriptional regulator
MNNISKKDKEILYHLDINSRKPLRKIAKELSLPENTLRYKIKKLEKNQIIKYYYTVINSYNLGFNVIKFYTKYKNICSSIKIEIINFFTDMKNTWVVSSTEGEFDLAVIFWIENITNFYPIWKNIFSRYSKYFINPKFYFQCEALSFRPTYLINKEKRTENEKVDISRKNSNVTIDTIDVKILRHLAIDARIPTIKLAKNLNLSTSIISNRINKLKKNEIIQSYRIEIDTSAFGFLHIKTDIFLNDLKDITLLINYFKRCPFVICIMKSIGYPHLEIEFNVKSISQFHQLMLDFIDKNPCKIKNYNYIHVLNRHKMCWIPEIIF